MADRDEAHQSRRRPPLPALATLHLDHPGLTPAISEAYSEAAFVTLARCLHPNVVDFNIDESAATVIRAVSWDQPDHRTLLAWANRDDATRDGAYSMSLAAVQAECGLVALRRAETKTGADYYLVPEDHRSGNDLTDFENAYRLEVSGVATGLEADVKRRVNEKLAQLRAGSDGPAYAAVVGFKARLIILRKLDGFDG